MLLIEFMYFSSDNDELDDHQRYDPGDDISPLNVNDTRKTRLTLKMINKLRISSEARDQEQMQERSQIQAMYKQPAPEGQGMM